MRTYEDVVRLAEICAREAWIASTPQIAAELWRMAKEYQAAAEHHRGEALDIGEPPPWAAKVASHRGKLRQVAIADSLWGRY
jgi:hypothetical protein